MFKHAPGYLPENAIPKKQQTTVARMQMPTDKLDFIRHTFGDKISKGKGCLLECLY